MLRKPEASGRLHKWAIELGQFNVNYRPRTTIKGHALTDFIVEFTYSNTIEVVGTTDNIGVMKGVEIEKGTMSVARQKDVDQWILYVDGASNKNGSRTGMMLISPKGHKINYALCFGFPASNNEAKYEALIVGLRLARESQVHHLKVYNDSQLVVNQVNDIYHAMGEKMVAYLAKARELIKAIPMVSIEVVLQSKNRNADALAKLAFTKDAELLVAVSVEFLANIKQQLEVMELELEPSWMDPTVAYLKKDEQNENKTKA